MVSKEDIKKLGDKIASDAQVDEEDIKTLCGYLEELGLMVFKSCEALALAKTRKFNPELGRTDVDVVKFAAILKIFNQNLVDAFMQTVLEDPDLKIVELPSKEELAQSHYS